MTTPFVFRLPSPGLSVRPAFQAVRMIEPKSYLAVVEFPGARLVDDIPPGLSWSESLRAFFQYLPHLDAAGVGHLNAFAAPRHGSELRIHIKPWSAEAARSPDVVARMALEVEMLGRNMSILPERA